MKVRQIFFGKLKKRMRRERKPLGMMMFVMSVGIFFIMLTVMSIQSILFYLYLRNIKNAPIRMPPLWRPIPLLLILSAIVGTTLAGLLTRIPLKPIQQLIDAINQLAKGNFHARIHLNATRELERLSDSFNSMAQELENTELLRSDFINNFSHEFKTPIVSLRGFARLLKNGNLSQEERDEYLDIIISESNRLSQLATNVLNLSKIENISILSDLETFDLSEEIRQSLLLLESKWQSKEIELIIDMDELEYYGNKNLLNQVWINLIDNAIKFSPDKGKIKLKLHEGRDDGQEPGTKNAQSRNRETSPSPWPGPAVSCPAVIFQILDNGCGMDREAQKHIFDRFYQGDTSHTSQGNGIGLTVVQKIVELHRGSIHVQSEAGIGATFTVILPR